jgi:glucokinase
MKNNLQIAIDLGGTNIRIGLFENGTLRERISKALVEKDKLQSTIDQLFELIGQFVSPAVTGIGIGVPSVVDTQKGIVYNVTNIPSWTEVPLKDILEGKFGLPVHINNDVNCFVLGEHAQGKAVGCASVVGLTIGTGLGAGIIIDHKLYAGNNTGAGEIGLLPYHSHDLEYYCSSHFFMNKLHVSAKETYEKALSGDKQSIEAWSEFGVHVAQAIKYAVLAYDPEVIVIGGSISKANKLFSGSMHEALSDFPFPKSIEKLRIEWSENELSNLIGALCLLKSQSIAE